MKFFKLEDKDCALSNLNGAKPKFVLKGIGLTPALQDLRKELIKLLHARNFNIPGVEVEFCLSGSGKQMSIHVFSVKIPSMDFAMVSDYSIRCGIMDMDIHEDASGSLEVYCGKDWDKDKEEFIKGVRHHRKMNKKSRIVLQYDLRRAHYNPFSDLGFLFGNERFVATDDCDRGHYPEGDEPTEYTLIEIENRFRKMLKAIISYLSVFPEQAPDPKLFEEPFPVFLTNPIFAGSVFHSFIDENEMPRLASDDPANDYGIQQNVRLLPLSIYPPKAHPLGKYMNEGFVYCDITWADGTESVNYFVPGSYSSREKKKVGIQLDKMDNVFIVDMDAGRRFKAKWFKSNPKAELLEHDAYHQMLIEIASTLVHINDYQGGYVKPVVAICRTVGRNEVKIL